MHDYWLSDSEIEVAVEIISIFLLDLKYICLERKYKKKPKLEFWFSFACILLH